MHSSKYDTAVRKLCGKMFDDLIRSIIVLHKWQNPVLFQTTVRAIYSFIKVILGLIFSAENQQKVIAICSSLCS